VTKIKTNLHRQYQISNDLEEQGFWYEATSEIRIRIRRLNSKPSLDARKEAEKPYTSQIRAGKAPDDVLEEIANKQLSYGVIADWEGIVDEAGKEVPYTGETAYGILSDPEMREFAADLFQQSVSRDNFKAVNNEEAVKNS
jgi:hypothetical protein